MGIIKKWNKKVKAVEPEEVDDGSHLSKPVGTITGVPIRGDFVGLPFYGYVAQRDKTETKVVVINYLLMKYSGDAKVRSSLQVEYPVLPETETAVVRLLVDLGWNPGSLWPRDACYPTGDASEGTMRQVHRESGLLQFLTFAYSEGNDESGQPLFQAPRLQVERSNGPFLMPALQAGAITEEEMEGFQAILDPALFFPVLN